MNVLKLTIEHSVDHPLDETLVQLAASPHLERGYRLVGRSNGIGWTTLMFEQA